MTGGEFGCVKEAHEYQTTLNKNQFNGHLSQKPFNFYLTFDQGCYWLNEDLKTKNIKILLQKLIEEETQAAQETETETETQEEETQAAPKAKRLKASTLKSYDAKALAKHLDNLPSDSYRVDFQYGTIYEWMETDLRLCSDLEVNPSPSSYVFYSTLIDKDKIKEAILDVYHELGI